MTLENFTTLYSGYALVVTNDTNDPQLNNGTDLTIVEMQNIKGKIGFGGVRVWGIIKNKGKSYSTCYIHVIITKPSLIYAVAFITGWYRTQVPGQKIRLYWIRLSVVLSRLGGQKQHVFVIKRPYMKDGFIIGFGPTIG